MTMPYLLLIVILDRATRPAIMDRGKLPQNIGLSARGEANLHTKRKRAVFFSFYQLLVAVNVSMIYILVECFFLILDRQLDEYYVLLV